MPSREHRLATAVLVVGTGGSGLRAAVELAESGVAVLAVGKRETGDAHTVLAAGGISAALAAADPRDTWEQHAADTLQESSLLADPRTVQLVARSAARSIHDLERLGMRFDQQLDGRIAQRWSGAHTYPRTVFADEHTGAELQRVLIDRATQLAVPMLSTCYLTRLLVDHGQVFGAYGFDLVDGSRYLVHADAVILATGGHTGIWRQTSARRGESVGDSLRLAAEAGASLRDAEMVQFHPSGLLQPENAAGGLVSEAARGEGAVLLNNLGERFMVRYDPERMELTRPEMIARACYTEIAEGRGTRAGGVWLDLSHLPSETVLTRLPRLHQRMHDLQMLDVTRDPIEVAPTAHFSMGGVQVSPEDNATSVAGLFVIGEAASGLHGASRLAGNSLLELLVQGQTAARAAAGYSARLASQNRSLGAERDAEADLDRALATNGTQNARALQREVRQLMTRHAGPVREEPGLRAGLDQLGEIESRADDIGIQLEISGFQDVAYAYDLRSAMLSARATLECAAERRETRGCHQRSDYPDRDPAFQVNLVWSMTDGVHRQTVPPIPTDIAVLMHDIAMQRTLIE